MRASTPSRPWDRSEPLPDRGRELEAVPRAGRANDDTPARYELRKRFWSGLNEYVRARFPNVPAIESRTSRSIRLPSDIQHVGFDVYFVPGHSYVDIDVCFWREPSFKLWERIRANPAEWNSLIGGTWEFEGSANKKRGYMSVWREISNLRDEASWQENRRADIRYQGE